MEFRLVKNASRGMILMISGKLPCKICDLLLKDYSPEDMIQHIKFYIKAQSIKKKPLGLEQYFWS